MTDRPAHVNIRSMPINSFVDGVYNLVNPQIGVTRTGEPFLKCLLRDASGEMPARKWRFSEKELSALTATGFVWVAGNTELYQDQPQLKIEQIRSVEVGEEELSFLLPASRRSIDEMFLRLCEILNSLSHPGMLALAREFLGDPELMTSFRRAPAATSLHHAWIGGLLEHTLQLLELADRMLPLYPELNRDIVLLGLFLHDIGKLWELTWERGFAYTSDGNLIGHVVRGAIVLQFKAAQANKSCGGLISADALRVLQHIIVSHHGQHEHGAPKLPSTPEAIFVAMLDNLDAKTQMALSAVRRGELGASCNGAFTDKVWALDTRLYRPDPLASRPENAPGASGEAP